MEDLESAPSFEPNEISRILLGPDSPEKEALQERLRANYQALSPEEKIAFNQKIDKIQQEAALSDEAYKNLLKESAEARKRAQELLDEKITRTLTMWSTTGAHYRAQQALDNLREVARDNNVRCLISTQRSWLLPKDYAAELYGRAEDVYKVASWWNKARI